jgi:PEGA domain
MIVDSLTLKSVLIAVAIFTAPLTQAGGQATTTTPAPDKPRVYVTDSQSWEMVGGWGMSGNRNANGSGSVSGGGYTAGGARPQTAEIIKTFNERCPEVIITNNVQKADFAVILDHEGGKGLLRHRNKIAVFNRNGDAIFSDSTRELGNSVKDACQAILSPASRPREAVSETPQPTALAPQSANSRSVETQIQASANAEIEVASTPGGAEIELDGTFVGSTPSTIGVAAGDHVIIVQKNGYKSWQRKLRTSTGKVNITAELEADVKREQKLEAAVPPEAPTTPVPTRPVSHETAGVSPPEVHGTILLGSNPDGAEIYSDGVFVGKTPTTLSLKPGQHSIRIFMKGYKNWSQWITVDPKSEAQLTAALVKAD